MKKIIFLSLALAIACTKKAETTATKGLKDPSEIITPAQPEDSSQLVVPGVSIGKAVIGSPVETLSGFGAPDFSDSAMGKAWLVWYDAKSNEVEREARLMIYTAYEDKELKKKVVAEIRVTSGEYKTESGIAAGTSFEVVQKEFPGMKEFAKYRNQRIKKDMYIYDVAGSGIAFEFASYEGDYAKCTAIIVYGKDSRLNTDYIMNLPERSLPGGE